MSDVDRSVAFYQQFGFEVLTRNSKPEFALRLGDGTIGLLKVDLAQWPRALRGTVHIELSTDNVDTLFAQLQAQGVDLATPPRARPWERQMFTMDPDGYRLEIAQGRSG